MGFETFARFEGLVFFLHLLGEITIVSVSESLYSDGIGGLLGNCTKILLLSVFGGCCAAIRSVVLSPVVVIL